MLALVSQNVLFIIFFFCWAGWRGAGKTCMHTKQSRNNSGIGVVDLLNIEVSAMYKHIIF